MDMTAGSDAVCDTCGNFMAKHGSRTRLAPVENAPRHVTAAMHLLPRSEFIAYSNYEFDSTIIFIVQYFIVSCTDCLLLSFLSVFVPLCWFPVSLSSSTRPGEHHSRFAPGSPTGSEG